MRKIQTKAAWVATHSPLFACPICHRPLSVNETSLICEAGHRFDLAKKGTVNFLNRPAPTEYDEPMLAARRRVLQAGLFNPFLEQIKAALTPADRVLDVGCGEGTPTALLASSGASSVGFDISAPAIKLAGSLAGDAFFCVADLARLPFIDQTFTALVDLFSPGAYAEFDRVLRPGGQLFKVIPAAGYLRELRLGLYAGTAKATYSNARVKERLLEAYPSATSEPLTYDFPVDRGLFADVVKMTPLAWQADPIKRAALVADPPASVHVEVELLHVTKS